MNAKQTEQATGISRRNLRFYEQQGLIHPARNADNDYRDYSQEDIEALKLIRALRMLDAPLEEIGACLRKEMTVAELSAEQEQRLLKKQQEVEISLSFCRQLQKAPAPDAAYIDQLLTRMDAPEVRDGLFETWKKDYEMVAAAEGKKAFSFTPDEAVTTPEAFTTVLLKYADENNLNLVITREGLAPEFEIDGIAYSAQRIYRRMGPVPVMIVRCTALHPEELDGEVPGAKGKLMRFFHNWWLLLVFAVIWLPRVFGAEKPWEVLLVGIILAVVMISCCWVYRNHKN